MNSRVEQKQQDTIVVTSETTAPDSFNFDLWATAVKRQMIASLRRRGEQ